MLKLTFAEETHPTVELTRSRTTIGRDPENNVVLTDDGISGFHAEIQLDRGKLYLVDLGSSNGTFLDGVRITGKEPLNAWSSLRFDNVEAEITDTDSRRPTVVRKAVNFSTPAADTPEWSLEGISGSMAGKRFSVAAPMTVGRDPECDIIPEETKVSTFHAKLEPSSGGLFVQDENSSNGTFVNGTPVRGKGPWKMETGDEVAFDRVTFKVTGPPRQVAKTEVRPPVHPTEVRKPVHPEEEPMPEDPPGPPDPVAEAWLEVVEGAVSGSRFDLFEPAARIGRTEANDVILDNDTISSSHATCTLTDDGWQLEDTGSSNGTFVNEKELKKNKPRQVVDGDELRIGEVALIFHALQGEGRSGTSIMGEVTTAYRKPIPAWVYGLIVFVVVALAGGTFLFWDPLFGSRAPIPGSVEVGRIWSQTMDGRTNPTTPALSDVNGDAFLDVVVADADGILICLDGQEGKKIFQVDTKDRIVAPPAVGDLSGDGVDDFVVASSSGMVSAVNGNGLVLWQSAGDLALGDIINRPVLENINDDKVPDVIVPTGNKGLVALDGARGWQIWETGEMCQGKAITSPLRADLNGDGRNDFLIVTDAGQVLAITSQDNRPWRIWEANVGKIIYSSPVYYQVDKQGLVVVATHGEGIVALNAANGRMAWISPIKKPFFASLTAADANGDEIPDVVATAENGDIHILNGLNGDEIWSIAIGQPVKATPALNDVDGDGLTDLVVLDETGRLSLIGMGPRKRILDIPVTDVSKFISSPVMGDVNNDGLLDFVLAGENGVITAYSVNKPVDKGSSAWPVFLGNDWHSVQ